jgi:hypothetical protein
VWLVYLAGGWFLLEVLDFVASTFGWPEVVGHAVTVLVGVGFGGTLILAWYHGDWRDPDLHGHGKGRERTRDLRRELFLVL